MFPSYLTFVEAFNLEPAFACLVFDFEPLRAQMNKMTSGNNSESIFSGSFMVLRAWTIVYSILEEVKVDHMLISKNALIIV